MRRESQSTAKRNAESQKFRSSLKRRVGRCEVCGHDPLRVSSGFVRWALHVHEIRGNSQRSKCQDMPFGVLVVCSRCHMEHLSSSGPNAEYPEARQLAVLKRSRPGDYDLARYTEEFHPNAPLAITQEEVDGWLKNTGAPGPS